jgi:hypothetical protein
MNLAFCHLVVILATIDKGDMETACLQELWVLQNLASACVHFRFV